MIRLLVRRISNFSSRPSSGLIPLDSKEGTSGPRRVADLSPRGTSGETLAVRTNLGGRIGHTFGIARVNGGDAFLNSLQSWTVSSVGAAEKDERANNLPESSIVVFSKNAVRGVIVPCMLAYSRHEW